MKSKPLARTRRASPRLDDPAVLWPQFIAALSGTPRQRVLALCAKFFDTFDPSSNVLHDRLPEMLEPYGYLKSMNAQHRNLGIPIEDLSGVFNDDATRIVTCFSQTRRQLQQAENRDTLNGVLDAIASKYAGQPSEAAFVLSADDAQLIQSKINELRDLITNAEHLSSEHRERVLDRLERLQQEIHKGTSTFESVIGTAYKVGALISQLGEDAQPMVERLREIVDIAVRGYQIFLGLPPRLRSAAATQRSLLPTARARRLN